MMVCVSTTRPSDSDPTELIVDFLNTLDVDDATDQLDDETGWARWAADHSLHAGDLELARRCRDALRDWVIEPERFVALPPVPLVLTTAPDATGRLAPPPESRDDASATVLAAVAALVLTGRWERVKICPADDCREAFYDRSRNTSRQWCSMAVCGNRAKSRTFRGRAE